MIEFGWYYYDGAHSDVSQTIKSKEQWRKAMNVVDAVCRLLNEQVSDWRFSGLQALHTKSSIKIDIHPAEKIVLLKVDDDKGISLAKQFNGEDFDKIYVAIVDAKCNYFDRHDKQFQAAFDRAILTMRR